MHLLAVSVLRDKSCQVNVWYWWFIGLIKCMKDTDERHIWMVQPCTQVVWGWFVILSFYDDTFQSWRAWSVLTWQFRDKWQVRINVYLNESKDKEIRHLMIHTAKPPFSQKSIKLHHQDKKVDALLCCRFSLSTTVWKITLLQFKRLQLNRWYNRSYLCFTSGYSDLRQ